MMRIPASRILWCVILSVYWIRHSAASLYLTRFDQTLWDDENWRLLTTSLDPGHFQSRSSLSNGYLGINVAALGPFFEVDVPVNGDGIGGWPLFDRRQSFATVAGFWDEQNITGDGQTNFPWLSQYGGESAISGIPHWAGIHIRVGDHLLEAATDPSEIAGFSSVYDFGAGLVSWRYTWTPPQSVPIDVEYSMLTHRLYINQAVVRLKMTAARCANVTVIDVLNGDAAVRTNFQDKASEVVNNTIWTSVSPMGISPDESTAFVYSRLGGPSFGQRNTTLYTDMPLVEGNNASSIAQYVNFTLVPGETITLDKFVGIASGKDAFENPQDVARGAAQEAYQTGYTTMLMSHSGEWQSIMSKDSIDDYKLSDGSLLDDADLIDLQILAVANPFYMLQNLPSPNALQLTGNNSYLKSNSIPVSGWTADSYAGQIFWDVEVWMQPGLVVAYPELTQSIANYRLRLYDQAKRNIATAYQSSQANRSFDSDAAIFPWTSGRFGNCTAVGPCWDYEYHINGDIGLELDSYCMATGAMNMCQEDYFPIYRSIASMYASLVELNETTGLYELHNATDPDEFANHVDNAAYTMVLIGQHLNRTNDLLRQTGSQPNEKWAEIATKLAIPVDPQVGLIKEFETMDGTVDVKQADVVLIDSFLGWPNPYTLSDLDFYAGRQSAAGPAMTFGVFSIVASLASPSGCSAFTYDLYGSSPYLRGPWYQYSEQLIDNYQLNGGFHPSFPFLTGMGGSNYVSVAGYLGYRAHVDYVEVNPSLPPQIPQIRYRTIYWQGHPVLASSNQTHTTISRGNGSLPTANPLYNEAIRITNGADGTSFNLTRSMPVVISNRQPGLNLTTPGNLAQCVRAASAATIVPGQFPLAAVDGAVSTAWQPSIANATSTLVIDLGADFVPRQICGFQFDWAQAVPLQVNISLTNSSSDVLPYTDTAATATCAAATGQPANATRACSLANVPVSLPYDPSTASRLTQYRSNSTFAALPQYAGVWSARYLLLAVSGNQANLSAVTPGPSVADFAVLEAGSPGCNSSAVMVQCA